MARKISPCPAIWLCHTSLANKTSPFPLMKMEECREILATLWALFYLSAYYIIFLSFDNPKTPDGVDDSSSNPMSNGVESVMAMFLMSMANFGDYYGAFEKTEHEMVAKGMFVIYMAIVAVLLVNMLIAMMGNTYQKIAETRNEWQRQVNLPNNPREVNKFSFSGRGLF